MSSRDLRQVNLFLDPLSTVDLMRTTMLPLGAKPHWGSHRLFFNCITELDGFDKKYLPLEYFNDLNLILYLYALTEKCIHWQNWKMHWGCLTILLIYILKTVCVHNILETWFHPHWTKHYFRAAFPQWDPHGWHALVNLPKIVLLWRPGTGATLIQCNNYVVSFRLLCKLLYKNVHRFYSGGNQPRFLVWLLLCLT